MFKQESLRRNELQMIKPKIMRAVVVTASLSMALCALPMTGCKSVDSSGQRANQAETSQQEFTFDQLDATIKVGNLSVKYPSSWQVSMEDGASKATIYPPCGGVVSIDASQVESLPTSVSDPSMDVFVSSFFDGIMNVLSECISEPYSTSVEGDSLHAVMNFTGVISGNEQKGYALLGVENGQNFQVIAVVPPNQYEAYGPYIEGMAAFFSMAPSAGQQPAEQPAQAPL